MSKVDEGWETRTLDEMVAAAKAEGHSIAVVRGATKPEGWPVFVFAAVGKPGSEGTIRNVASFYEAVVMAITTPPVPPAKTSSDAKQSKPSEG